MPHIIVEYSKNLGDIIDIPALVQTLHNTLAAQGVDKSRIKTRAVSRKHVAVGEHGLHGHMMHAELSLLEGRDLATKRKYGDALHGAMKTIVGDAVQNCAITLEIRDMAKETYYM